MVFVLMLLVLSLVFSPNHGAPNLTCLSAIMESEGWRIIFYFSVSTVYVCVLFHV
jgi:hypothetical protein